LGKNEGIIYSWAMSTSSIYGIRNYRFEDADKAASIRGTTSELDRERFEEIVISDKDWSGHYRHFAIHKNGEVIGDIQLRRCQQTMPPGVAHVGIDILESARGQGAGTSALELVWEWAKSENFHRLEGSTDVLNIAMRKAFEKAGWEFEGVLKSLFYGDGIAHDYSSYAKTISIKL